MNDPGNSGARRRLIAAAVVATIAIGASATASGAVGAAPMPTHDRASGQQAAAGGWTVLHYSIGRQRPRAVHDGRRQRDGHRRFRRQPRTSSPWSTDPAEYGEDPALDVGDWVGAKVLQILPGDTSVELADLGPTDMGDPTTLSTLHHLRHHQLPGRSLRPDHLRPRGQLAGRRNRRECRRIDALLARHPAGTADRTHRCRCRAPRPARLRRLPDGHVRGRQCPAALRRPADRQLRDGTGHRVGLPRARHARRRPEHQRRRLRRGDRRQLHRQQHSRQHAGADRPRPDAGARLGDGDVLVGAGRADRHGGPRGRPHARRQPGVRPESRSDPGLPHDRPGNADGHDQRRSARRRGPGRRRARCPERCGALPLVRPAGAGVLGAVDLLPTVGRLLRAGVRLRCAEPERVGRLPRELLHRRPGDRRDRTARRSSTPSRPSPATPPASPSRPRSTRPRSRTWRAARSATASSSTTGRRCTTATRPPRSTTPDWSAASTTCRC